MCACALDPERHRGCFVKHSGPWPLIPGSCPVSQLGFEPIFDSYLAVALLALALLLLLGLKPQFGSLTRRRRWTLLGLRAVVVLLAIMALLRPTWITTIRTPQSSVLLILLDASR